jgi:hypothetical protein
MYCFKVKVSNRLLKDMASPLRILHRFRKTPAERYFRRIVNPAERDGKNITFTPQNIFLFSKSFIVS